MIAQLKLQDKKHQEKFTWFKKKTNWRTENNKAHNQVKVKKLHWYSVNISYVT